MVGVFIIILNIIIGGALIAGGASLLSGAMEAWAEAGAGKAFGFFNTPITAFFASILITAGVQSSSAVTVLTVSMANAGVLSLEAAMAAVYGANIGTTVTAQLLSLDISAFSPYILAAGVLLLVLFRTAERRPSLPMGIMGLGTLLAGLAVLKSSAALIKNSAYVMNFINQYSESAFWCVLFGFAATALVHSSSATVGLTIAMFSGGVIGFREAALITLGDNIGTCVTAQMAAVAGGSAGTRVAWGNMFYNIICAALALVFFDSFTEFALFITRLLGQTDSYLIANTHTLLNLLGALLFLPVNGGYCRVLEFFIGGGRRGREA